MPGIDGIKKTLDPISNQIYSGPAPIFAATEAVANETFQLGSPVTALKAVTDGVKAAPPVAETSEDGPARPVAAPRRGLLSPLLDNVPMVYTVTGNHLDAARVHMEKAAEIEGKKDRLDRETYLIKMNHELKMAAIAYELAGELEMASAIYQRQIALFDGEYQDISALSFSDYLTDEFYRANERLADLSLRLKKLCLDRQRPVEAAVADLAAGRALSKIGKLKEACRCFEEATGLIEPYAANSSESYDEIVDLRNSLLSNWVSSALKLADVTETMSAVPPAISKSDPVADLEEAILLLDDLAGQGYIDEDNRAAVMLRMGDLRYKAAEFAMLNYTDHESIRGLFLEAADTYYSVAEIYLTLANGKEKAAAALKAADAFFMTGPGFDSRACQAYTIAGTYRLPPLLMAHLERSGSGQDIPTYLGDWESWIDSADTMVAYIRNIDKGSKMHQKAILEEIRLRKAFATKLGTEGKSQQQVVQLRKVADLYKGPIVDQRFKAAATYAEIAGIYMEQGFYADAQFNYDFALREFEGKKWGNLGKKQRVELMNYRRGHIYAMILGDNYENFYDISRKIDQFFIHSYPKSVERMRWTVETIEGAAKLLVQKDRHLEASNFYNTAAFIASDYDKAKAYELYTTAATLAEGVKYYNGAKHSYIGIKNLGYPPGADAPGSDIKVKWMNAMLKQGDSREIDHFLRLLSMEFFETIDWMIADKKYDQAEEKFAAAIEDLAAFVKKLDLSGRDTAAISGPVAYNLFALLFGVDGLYDAGRREGAVKLAISFVARFEDMIGRRMTDSYLQAAVKGTFSVAEEKIAANEGAVKRLVAAKGLDAEGLQLAKDNIQGLVRLTELMEDLSAVRRSKAYEGLKLILRQNLAVACRAVAKHSYDFEGWTDTVDVYDKMAGEYFAVFKTDSVRVLVEYLEKDPTFKAMSQTDREYAAAKILLQWDLFELMDPAAKEGRIAQGLSETKFVAGIPRTFLDFIITGKEGSCIEDVFLKGHLSNTGLRPAGVK